MGRRALAIIPYIPFPSGSVGIAAGGLQASSFAAGAITAAKFAAGAIDAAAIANGAIDAATFAASAIDAAAFAQAAADKPWATATRALTDKVGFTLTAGSYTIRASSSQRGEANISAGTTVDIAVSSVTLTRAFESMNGWNANTSGTSVAQYAIRAMLVSSTVFRGTFLALGNTQYFAGAVKEEF
jgi:hypothetical protein